MQEIGKVTRYFGKIGVGVIELSAEVKVGDRIHIKGATTDFEQSVESMQIDQKPVEVASSGLIAIKTADVVRDGDAVYKVAE